MACVGGILGSYPPHVGYVINILITFFFLSLLVLRLSVNFLCVLERKMTTRALHFLVLVVF